MKARESILTLAIETSNPSASIRRRGEVALARVSAGGAMNLLGIEKLRPKVRHDDDLIPAIDRMMKRAGEEAGNLGRIAVSIGPGAFTSVRIAVATAKLLGEGTGAEVVGVPTVEVVAQARRQLGVFGVSLASKRDTAWIAFCDGTQQIRDGEILDQAALARALDDVGARAFVADRFLPETLRRVIESRGIAIVAPLFSAARCLEASVGMAAEEALALAPVYPREPEAVRMWRERGSATAD